VTARLLREPDAPAATLGHRGHSAGAPENTLAALQMAAERGAAWCELDVTRCADGLVVVHDSLLERTTSGLGLVRARTLAEIQDLDAGSWFDPAFASERVPSLREALAAARGHGMGLVIEPKERFTFETDALMTMIAEDVRATGMADHVVIASFEQTALPRARAAMPDVATELITTGQLVDPVATARTAGADMLSFDLKRFHPEDARALHGSGIAVRLSLPDVAELDALERYGLGLVARLRRWLDEGLIDILSCDDIARAAALAEDRRPVG
jgi:glycerophosphoryl diester phosphodiesterase